MLIADEPTTALDVTIQAQILELMRDMRARTGTSIVLITHDMGVVAEMADRVMVMYCGRKVEEGTRGRGLRASPATPTPWASSARFPCWARRGRSATPNSPRSPASCRPSTDLPTGCRFSDRCRFSTEKCVAEDPPLEEKRNPVISAACWHSDQLEGSDDRAADPRNVENLVKRFPLKRIIFRKPRYLAAVNGVSLRSDAGRDPRRSWASPAAANPPSAS